MSNSSRPLPRRGHQVAVLSRILVQRVALMARFGAERQQILLLGGQRFGTVNGEQRSPLVNLPAGEIGETLSIQPSSRLWTFETRVSSRVTRARGAASA